MKNTEWQSPPEAIAVKDLLHHSSKKRKDEANTSPQIMSVVTEPVHLTAMPLQNGDGHPLAGCRGGQPPPAKNKRQSHSATNQPSFIMQFQTFLLFEGEMIKISLYLVQSQKTTYFFNGATVSKRALNSLPQPMSLSSLNTSGRHSSRV